MTTSDYLVLLVYLVAIVAAGMLFKDRFSNVRDYFAAGGNMLWWMAGFSAITSELSVFGFTGSASRYATEGLLLLYANLASYATLPLLYWLGPRFRRLRVTTGLEAVGLRFGPRTELFYSVLVIPLGIWMGAMGLHVTAVFFSAASGLSPNLVVGIVGGFIVIMSALGGIWAVATSDLFQGTLTLFMMLVLLCLAATHPHVVAAGGLWQSLPHRLVDPFAQTTPLTVGIWVFAMTLVTLMSRLSVLHDGWKFIVTRSEQDCRRMVTVFLVIGLCMTPLIALPSVVSPVILGPDALASATHASEGVIAHLARAIMPPGLMGLMLAGIVAAAMNSMDHALNRNAGFFVTSIYQRLVRVAVTGAAAVRVSRLATILFGGLSMSIALALNANRQSTLFDFVLRINSLLVIPLMVPLAMGLLFRRVPGWAGWSGALVCSAAGWLTDAFVSGSSLLQLTGIHPTSPRDAVDLKAAALVLATVGAGVLYFAGAQLWQAVRSGRDAPRVGEEFWQRWGEPVVGQGSTEAAQLQRTNAGRVLLGFGLGIACLLPFLGLGRQSCWVWGLVLCFVLPGALLLRRSRLKVAPLE